MKILGIILGALVALFVVAMIASNSPENSAKYEAKRRQACVDALMSNMGTSTVGYADKQAYNTRVADKCEGFDLKK